MRLGTKKPGIEELEEKTWMKSSKDYRNWKDAIIYKGITDMHYIDLINSMVARAVDMLPEAGRGRRAEAGAGDHAGD